MTDVQPLTALLNPERIERMRYDAATNGRPGLLIDNDIVVAMCEAIQSIAQQAETIRERDAQIATLTELAAQLAEEDTEWMANAAETIRELKAALAEERRKFQAETLRTSALTQLLIRAEAVLCPEHEPGAWSRTCERWAGTTGLTHERIIPAWRPIDD